jgi:hypothetical protein
MRDRKVAWISGTLRAKLGPEGCRMLTVLLTFLAMGIVLAANYVLLAGQAGGMTRKDFMTLWTGGRALVLGLNPYDEAVWRPLSTSYGDTWLPNAICVYPMWTILFFVPFSFLPTQMAGAMWMTLCEIALLGGIVLTAHALRWPKYGSHLPWLLIGLALFRPIFPAISNGQLAPMLFFLLAAAYYSHTRGHFFAAGVLLALQIAKPNLTLLFVPLVGLILLTRRDWRTLSGLVAGGLALLAASWIVLPGWVLSWLGAAEKARMASITPTWWGLSYDLVGEAHWQLLAGGGVAAIILGTVLVIWRERHENLLFSTGLALAVSTFATPYLWAYDQLVLFFPAMVGLDWGITSGRGRAWVWTGAWLLIVVGLSWGLLYVAMDRGIDTLSAFVTVGVTAYFVVAWEARKWCRRQPHGSSEAGGAGGPGA